jgi:putative phosphonate catabolism associated alcohol dehydrogenase
MPNGIVQIFDGPGHGFRTANFPLPERLTRGEVLVKIELATVCGSDLHTISGAREEPVPCVLGHEAVGRIVTVDSNRRDLNSGDRVTWSIADSCGECVACTEYGLPQKCRSLFKYGHAALTNGSGLNGCYASHILLRNGTHVARVPETLPDSVVAPANCALATMVNAVSQLPDHCHRVVIQGTGLLGLYGCALLRERGVRQIFCVDIQEHRLKQVPQFGGIPVDGCAAQYPLERERILAAVGGEVDAIFEVAGVPGLVVEGLRLLRPGGFYCFVGMVHPQTQLAVTGEQIIRKCLTIRGVHNYGPWHLDEAISFLARTARQYPYESLVSKPFPLVQLDDAVREAETRQWFRVSVKAE